MTRTANRILPLLLLVAVLAPAAQAQAPRGDADAGSGELQREMQKFFADRLRSELSLSDGQVEQILPRIRQFERERNATRRERMQTMRLLHRSLRQGGTDSELKVLLDRLDASERRQLELKQTAFAEIDESLSVRQRANLRIFVERFQRMMREKIMDIRGGGSGTTRRLGAQPPPPPPPSQGRR